MPGDGLDDPWIEVGRVLGPFGVKGAVKVEPWAAPDESVLVSAGRWRLTLRGGQSLDLPVRSVSVRSDVLIAEVDPAPSREEVIGWKGATVSVPRSMFPAPADDEYYWADLIGCEVVDVAGRRLGAVARVEEMGADPLLRVSDRLLIPFIEPYVVSVSLAERRIVVDWSEDWS